MADSSWITLAVAISLLARAEAAWSTTDLKVQRLSSRDAFGIDVVRPVFSWVWTTESTPETRGEPLPSHVHVGLSLQPWSNTGSAREQHSDLWSWSTQLENSFNNVSSDSVTYDGPQLPSATKVYWQVCHAATAASAADKKAKMTCSSSSFVTGLYSPEDWGSATWIGGRQLRSPTFAVPPAATSVVVAVTGLGFYELSLNGAKVGDAIMDPGFSTNYSERILYAVYDITNQTLTGTSSQEITEQNQFVFGARVGAGKYSYAVNPSAVPGQDVFALRLALTIGFENGTSLVTLVSDDTWMESESPIVWDNLYHGEVGRTALL